MFDILLIINHLAITGYFPERLVIANHLTLNQMLNNPRSIFERGMFDILLILNHLAVTGYFPERLVIANHLTLNQMLNIPRSIFERGISMKTL